MFIVTRQCNKTLSSQAGMGLVPLIQHCTFRCSWWGVVKSSSEKPWKHQFLSVTREQWHTRKEARNRTASGVPKDKLGFPKWAKLPRTQQSRPKSSSTSPERVQLSMTCWKAATPDVGKVGISWTLGNEDDRESWCSRRYFSDGNPLLLRPPHLSLSLPPPYSFI